MQSCTAHAVSDEHVATCQLNELVTEVIQLVHNVCEEGHDASLLCTACRPVTLFT